MKNVKNGFGGEIDPSEYDKRFPNSEENNSHTKRGKFIKFKLFYIGEKTILDEDLHNAAIRAKGNKDRGDEKISYSYKRRGWVYDDFPPIISTKNEIKDGRTRIRAALMNGEDYIPVAVFAYEDDNVDSYLSSITEGLIGNDGLINRPTEYEDLAEAGVHLVKQGLVLHNESSIAEWVYNEVEAERFVEEKFLPSLVSEINERVNKGEDAVIQIERDEIIKYLKKSPDIPNNVCYPGEVCITDVPRVLIYAAPSATNQGRLWGMIARNIPINSLIVLYTTKKIPSKMHKDYKDFVKSVDMRYEECFDIVNKTYASNGLSLGIKAPEILPYKVVGIYPQLPRNENHIAYRNAFKLIPFDDYGDLSQ